MLDALKFVKGAIAAKDYIPDLTHFRIANGRVIGYNGIIALSSPIDLQLTAMPKAKPFAAALEKLPEDQVVRIDVTPTGRLSVKAGKFRALVDCWTSDEQFVKIEPRGPVHPMQPGLLDVFARLAPFMGIDASRPWACGILLRGQSAFATNNILLVEHWLPMVWSTPFNIPSQAIKEMLRIGSDPIGIQVEENALTFHYESGAWLRTQLNGLEWPPVESVVDRPGNLVPVPTDLLDALDRVAPFCDKAGRVHIRGNTVSTTLEVDGDGATVELDAVAGNHSNYLVALKALAEVAEVWDLTQNPVPFRGGLLRGVGIGFRL